MTFQPMPTDILLYILLFFFIVASVWMAKQPQLRDNWQQVFRSNWGMVAAVILIFFVIVAFADSIHFKNNHNHQARPVLSLLDKVLNPVGLDYEKSYSAPFAWQLYSKSLITKPDGSQVRGYPHLKHAGMNIFNSVQRDHDVVYRLYVGLAWGFAISFLCLISFCSIFCYRSKKRVMQTLGNLSCGRTPIAWRSALITLCVLIVTACVFWQWMQNYHILGTDKIGKDVFYETLKSVRTGVLIGTLTTLFMLPFAVLLGVTAGYFGGIVDDIIQYIYTTLSSIPGVLLISAAVLSLQLYINNHAALFPTIEIRADARLMALCIILGVTSWTGLCRIMRAETLKHRQLEYVQAARSLGVGHFKILCKHIIPNMMYLVLITVVLDFSGLVLAEAVLSYVGVGVDPSMMSWGHMINSARLELAREPIVWWPLVAALVLMFSLVLSANIFADCVRDAFDPRVN